MIKNIGLVAGIAIGFLLAGGIVQSYRAQHETDKRLAELTQKLAEQSHAPAAQAAPTTAPAVSQASPLLLPTHAAPLPTEFAERQLRVQQVMDAGWKLINQRSPELAAHAVDLFQAGIEQIDPNSPDLYNGLGRSLLIAGKPREAIAAWRKGLALAPKLADMQSGVGWAYWHLNDPYDAKKAWDAAVALDPRSADAWSALAWVDLALGDVQTAKKGFQVLVARDAQSRPWVMGLAMAQASNGNVEQIGQFFRLPDLALFAHPPATDPAADRAVASTSSSL